LNTCTIFLTFYFSVGLQISRRTEFLAETLSIRSYFCTKRRSVFVRRTFPSRGLFDCPTFCSLNVLDWMCSNFKSENENVHVANVKSQCALDSVSQSCHDGSLKTVSKLLPDSPPFGYCWGSTALEKLWDFGFFLVQRSANGGLKSRGCHQESYVDEKNVFSCQARIQQLETWQLRPCMRRRKIFGGGVGRQRDRRWER
jgi:hypothetical protein